MKCGERQIPPHHQRLASRSEGNNSPASWEREGTVKLIKLTKGQWAKVSDHRYEEFSKYNWHARWHTQTQGYYACRNENTNPDGKPWKNSVVRMHRQILGINKGERNSAGKLLQGLHLDGDSLNNQDDNLTRGTNSQNSMNRKLMMANNTSGFKGVYFRKRTIANPWGSFVKVNGKMIHLGFRATRAEAIELRREGEKKYYGEFARTA